MNRIAPMAVALFALVAAPLASPAQTAVVQAVPHHRLTHQRIVIAPRPLVHSVQPGFDATPGSSTTRAGLSRNSANCKFGCIDNGGS